jgi:hypothetical protein
MGSLNKYNLFPPYVWILIAVSLTAGFFMGAITQSLAIKEDDQKTCDWIHRK